ncbi:DUF5819 family protein [Microbacterium album]|uniref:Uncharacterized protein n=1 Tax=Microbacterium album TaxID=2053191 RepID=A0A917II19_9MICO|nr:DUF5819 family protein [Microbacterium album]GGH50855.1 hypothetical protein GCM10010921_29880 [Microbacterium album]
MKTKSKSLRRIVVAGMAAFAAWHILATFLWVAPASPARDAIPGDALRSYMLPMFGQSWSVFAPSPINADYHLDVRALVDDGGELVETDWVRATDVELSYSRYNLTPPRAAGIAVSAASALYSAHGRLSDGQKEIVELNYFKDDWYGRLEQALADAGDDPAAYLSAERVVAAYATQVAFAVWGEDVTRVQFQVSREPVVPFEQRNDPDAERPAAVVRETGWRGLAENEGQSRSQFRDFFCSAPKEVC